MENKIMDYEKAYKEAFERAKNYHDNNFSFGTTQLTEAIFPELKEPEDERIRKKLYHTVLGTSDTDEWFEDISKDKVLAYLEKQKEQKPAEWSEEDEKIRQDIENLIIFALKEGSAVSPAAETTREQAINWLKSLRPQPHWKPSEEQMCALKYASTYVPDDEGTLAELYEQLKRL